MSTRRMDSGMVAARRRIPVPASSTRIVPSRPTTPTHEVFPPYRAVSCPGVAIEPRVPHRVTCISHFPENHLRAEELATPLEKKLDSCAFIVELLFHAAASIVVTQRARGYFNRAFMAFMPRSSLLAWCLASKSPVGLLPHT